MNPSVERFREATAQAPAHARERVWKRLQAPAQPLSTRAGWWLAVVAVAAVAVMAAMALRPVAPLPLTPYGGDGFVAVAPAGALVPRGNVLSITRGEVLVSSWGGPVEGVAGAHRVTTDAAVFALRVAADEVTLFVDEGAVLLDGVRFTAARRPGAPDFAPLRAAEPTLAAVERAWALAENAAAEGRTEEAIERFATLARQSSLRAEAALLREGQLELWNLHQPDVALATLASATARFPHGALGQEVAFSELEALVSLRRWPEATAKAAAFTERFPASERRAEVELVAAVAAAERGEPAQACRLLEGLDRSGLSAEQTQTATGLKARCTSFEH